MLDFDLQIDFTTEGPQFNFIRCVQKTNRFPAVNRSGIKSMNVIIKTGIHKNDIMEPWEFIGQRQ